jgi:hypothetical protein
VDNVVSHPKISDLIVTRTGRSRNPAFVSCRDS